MNDGMGEKCSTPGENEPWKRQVAKSVGKDHCRVIGPNWKIVLTLLR
jgi:hypothetical protein